MRPKSTLFGTRERDRRRPNWLGRASQKPPTAPQMRGQWPSERSREFLRAPRTRGAFRHHDWCYHTGATHTAAQAGLVSRQPSHAHAEVASSPQQASHRATFPRRLTAEPPKSGADVLIISDRREHAYGIVSNREAGDRWKPHPVPERLARSTQRPSSPQSFRTRPSPTTQHHQPPFDADVHDNDDRDVDNGISCYRRPAPAFHACVLRAACCVLPVRAVRECEPHAPVPTATLLIVHQQSPWRVCARSDWRGHGDHHHDDDRGRHTIHLQKG